MIYSGFADEAGATLQEQIDATKKLGWRDIDVRFVSLTDKAGNAYTKNFTDISDEDFDGCAALLQKAEIAVPCFGSAVANPSKDPTNPADTEYSVAALKRAIPRMQALGTKFIRGMAFAYKEDLSLLENEAVIFPLMREIVSLCKAGGIVYLCENCGGYAGNAYENINRLADYLESDYFKVAFDTGNPIGTLNKSGNAPHQPQDAWDFYRSVKAHIGYVHIKDQIANADGTVTRVFPGEGEAQVARIMKDLIDNGYDGYVAIEPHMHNGFDGYVAYGRRLEKIVHELKR